MDRKAIMVREGNLVDAIAASCAVPYMFSPMVFEGTLYRDGGFADRIGLRAWKSFAQTMTSHCVHTLWIVAMVFQMKKVLMGSRLFARLVLLLPCFQWETSWGN